LSLGADARLKLKGLEARKRIALGKRSAALGNDPNEFKPLQRAKENGGNE
jgi:hypothetical protein